MKEKKPLVSILTSCYNGSKFIEQYGECLLSQTYRPLECIIVNDGSEDDSGQLLDDLAKSANLDGIHTQIIHQDNTGNAVAISKAYGISTGDYITCWDIDDFFYSENISTFVEMLNNSPDCAAAHANGYYVNDLNPEHILGTFSERHPEYTGGKLFEHLLAGSSWNWAGAYMVKSHALEQVYGSRQIPSPRLWKNSQNLQLLLPASYAGCVYNPKIVMKYIQYSHSISHMDPSYKEDLKRVIAYEDIRQQLLEIMNLNTPEYLTIINKAFSRIKMQIAYKYNKRQDFILYFNQLKKLKARTTEDLLLNSLMRNDNKIKLFIFRMIHKVNLLLFS